MTQAAWPELPYAAWKDTYATLHLWTQIVGKIRLAQTPWLNHSWHVVLYVSARGLTTSPIPPLNSPITCTECAFGAQARKVAPSAIRFAPIGVSGCTFSSEAGMVNSTAR